MKKQLHWVDTLAVEVDATPYADAGAAAKNGWPLTS